MLSAGAWEAETECGLEPASIGCQRSSPYSPMLAFGDVAEEFLKALSTAPHKQVIILPPVIPACPWRESGKKTLKWIHAKRTRK